jgi:hypothetical protein
MRGLAVLLLVTPTARDAASRQPQSLKLGHGVFPAQKSPVDDRASSTGTVPHRTPRELGFGHGERRASTILIASSISSMTAQSFSILP